MLIEICLIIIVMFFFTVVLPSRFRTKNKISYKEVLENIKIKEQPDFIFKNPYKECEEYILNNKKLLKKGEKIYLRIVKPISGISEDDRYIISIADSHDYFNGTLSDILIDFDNDRDLFLFAFSIKVLLSEFVSKVNNNASEFVLEFTLKKGTFLSLKSKKLLDNEKYLRYEEAFYNEFAKGVK